VKTDPDVLMLAYLTLGLMVGLVIGLVIGERKG